MASIRVDTHQQELDVNVTADQKSAGPGDTVTYTVETKDYSGKPVSADVSLAVVDKAALALAPSNSQRILEAFYHDQALGIRTALGIVLNAEDYNAQYLESIPEGGGMGGGGGEESLGVISVRENFKDTAFFEGQAVTDEDGKAQFTVTLPENLTTWQADVRAVTGDSRVGQTTGELLSTKPLFVQLQTPRFFVSGDQATVGAIVHNNEDEPLTVDLALDAKGVRAALAGRTERGGGGRAANVRDVGPRRPGRGEACRFHGPRHERRPPGFRASLRSARYPVRASPSTTTPRPRPSARRG